MSRLVEAPSYWRRPLRLRHLDLRAWQASAMFEGSAVVTGLLALAEVVPPAAVLVVPLTFGVLVKAHDVLAGLLLPRR